MIRNVHAAVRLDVDHCWSRGIEEASLRPWLDWGSHD